MSIVATDAPAEISEQVGWTKSLEHSSSRDQLRYPDFVSNEQFDRHVSYRTCDMTAIDKDLAGFDFTWSSCRFEHIGPLQAGLQFVIDSVEQTLNDGGIACHTTEFNLSSNEGTLDHGPVVFYRKRDMQALVERLQDLGHEVQPFVVAPDSHYLDSYVDLPPYRQNPHLKLLMATHVVTSAGIVIRKNGLRDRRKWLATLAVRASWTHRPSHGHYRARHPHSGPAWRLHVRPRALDGARSTVRPWRHAPDGVPGGSRFATNRARLRAHRKLAGLRHRSRSPGSHR
ncbi:MULTISPECIES: hypothetical protein [unclassified Burkholderia]|uniref:hypothetical protein n=1 Tax=unclassified Burkholderia TaxID=2613784 RepID=UPI001E6578C3|nr:MULTISPECIES: hypothetical protein [unclassified Burkholderia]